MSSCDDVRSIAFWTTALNGIVPSRTVTSACILHHDWESMLVARHLPCREFTNEQSAVHAASLGDDAGLLIVRTPRLNPVKASSSRDISVGIVQGMVNIPDQSNVVAQYILVVVRVCRISKCTA